MGRTSSGSFWTTSSTHEGMPIRVLMAKRPMFWETVSTGALPVKGKLTQPISSSTRLMNTNDE
ncbi:hypothetical protein D3C87_1876920 [compost metagenome]